MSSTSNNALSHQPSTPQTTQDCEDTPPPKWKRFASALGKLWTGIKQAKNALAKHLNGNQRVRKLISPRSKKSAIPLKKPESGAQATDVANTTSTTSPSTVINQQADSETLTRPETPVAVTTATESSISLSSQPDISPFPISVPTTRQSSNIISLVDHQFIRPGTPFSEVSTLHNSTCVDVNSSHHLSDTPPPTIPQPNTGPATDVSTATPPHPILSQPVRPSAPPIRTDLDYSNIPGSDDEDSRSTVRGRSSIPASALDLHGMGGHFDESPSQ